MGGGICPYVVYVHFNNSPFNTMANFYYTDANGQRQGLINEQQLKALAIRGIITPDTELEADTGHKGKAGQIQGLFPADPFSSTQTVQPNMSVSVDTEKGSLYLVLGIVVALVIGGIGVFGGITILTLSPSAKQTENNAKQVANDRVQLAPLPPDFQSSFGDIFDAAQSGTVDDVRYFLDNGGEVNQQNGGGWTPLHLAAQYNSDVKVLEYLVSQGSDVNMKNNKDNLETPLHCAARSNTNVDVFQYLISQGANVNASNGWGATPLVFAIWLNSNVEVMKLLVSCGADVNAKTWDGRTPLVIAAGHSSPHVVDFLRYFVSVEGVNINAKSNDGKTPLDHAQTEEARTILRRAGGRSGR